MFLTNKGSDFYDVRSTVKGMRSARSSNGRPLIEAQPGRERSAEEARKLVLTTQQPAHLDRYLHRSESSPFPPEYSFYLLGDVRGKTVLDLGCGSGEIPLVRHGANVIGIDSPELVELAAKRLDAPGTEATLKVGFQLMKPVCNDGSIDVIFCMSLIHHLDIDKVSGEMLRVLAPTGYIVLKEPIRFSKSYAAVCKLVPEHSHISDFEHPLTQGELATIMEPFTAEGLRYFRLPIVPMTIRWLPAGNEVAWKLSAWALRNLPPTKVYATSIAMRLRRRASDSASLAA